MDWKLRKTDEKHVGRSTLSYELDLKAANVEQTHTQSEYFTPHAHVLSVNKRCMKGRPLVTTKKLVIPRLCGPYII